MCPSSVARGWRLASCCGELGCTTTGLRKVCIYCVRRPLLRSCYFGRASAGAPAASPRLHTAAGANACHSTCDVFAFAPKADRSPTGAMRFVLVSVSHRDPQCSGARTGRCSPDGGRSTTSADRFHDIRVPGVAWLVFFWCLRSDAFRRHEFTASVNGELQAVCVWD